MSTFIIAAKNDKTTAKVITKEEAYQFADELKEMNLEEYDASSRLIVSADKAIDYMGA